MKLSTALALVLCLLSRVMSAPFSISGHKSRDFGLGMLDNIIIGSHGGPSPIQTDQTMINNFELYSQYSAAAYCVDNNDSPSTQIKCSQGNCPLVEAANATGVLEFHNSAITDVTGFVALVPSSNSIVLSFRGSDSLRSFITDTLFTMMPIELCVGCEVHLGFWLSWFEARTEILDSFTALVQANPGYQLVVTGHSLGGAIALLAAAELRNQGLNVALYTYGQPRVGNPAFSSWVDSKPGAGDFRITHTDDTVPRLGPLALGYDHISPEYHIETDSATPSTTQIVRYNGDANLDGNAGTSSFDVAAHLNYFGPISKCASFQLIK